MTGHTPSSPDPLEPVRHLIECAEAAKREARETIRLTREAISQAADVQAGLPPEDRAQVGHGGGRPPTAG